MFNLLGGVRSPRAHHQNAPQTNSSAPERQTLYLQPTPLDRPVTA
jgi:hypothetical protein